MNPAGQVSLIVLDDGRRLTQSNALMPHLPEGSAPIPSESHGRAKMMEWRFWEQYSHEPYVAVRRFQVRYWSRSPASLKSGLVERAEAALQLLEESGGAFLLAWTLTPRPFNKI
ncbi:MAG TPA: hypothetical protein VJP88_10025 [Caulobacteraceae bacterium]|nr:hypothetical protein [Caulobacteraceae bacterium]